MNNFSHITETNRLDETMESTCSIVHLDQLPTMLIVEASSHQRVEPFVLHHSVKTLHDCSKSALDSLICFVSMRFIISEVLPVHRENCKLYYQRSTYLWIQKYAK